MKKDLVFLFNLYVQFNFQAEEVYSAALKSYDEVFHICLYDWLLCKNMSEKLLSVSTFASHSYALSVIIPASESVSLSKKLCDLRVTREAVIGAI